MDKVRRRGLVSIAVLALAAATVLAFVTWFVVWFFSTHPIFIGA